MILAELSKKQVSGTRKQRQGCQHRVIERDPKIWPGEQGWMKYQAPFVAQLEVEMGLQSTCPDLMLHFSSFKLTSNVRLWGV
jgi:hypothetical protein